MIAVDRYQTPAENLQAIHHILEARRTELRHGGLHIARQTFKGFVALPAPKGRTWRDVLGLSANETLNRATIDFAYRKAAKALHERQAPESDLIQLNLARDRAVNAL